MSDGARPVGAANQVIDRCDSTNDVARALGEAGHPHGTWVSARVQERGRGRLGREWKSLEGNLFLSILARPGELGIARAEWTWVPLAVAVGVAEALATLDQGLDIRVKWPNDLWIGVGADGAKVGGILCEAASGGGPGFVVVGIGLNCRELPEVSDQRATSLSAALGRAILADDARAAVLEGALGSLDTLAWAGKEMIARRFDSRAALPRGLGVEWGLGLAGEVVGLGEAGELLVRDGAGKLTGLYADDVKVRLGARGPSTCS